MIINWLIRRVQHSIRTRLLLLIVLVSLTPLVLVGLFATHITRDRLTDEALFRILSETAGYANQLGNFVTQQRINLLSYSNLPPVQGRIRAVQNGGIDPATFNTTREWDDLLLNYFGSIARSTEQYVSLEYTDATGNINALAVYQRRIGSINIFSRGAVVYNVSEREYFIEAARLANGEIYISPIEYRPLAIGTSLTSNLFGIETETDALFFMATPVYSREGEFNGIVNMAVFADTIFPLLQVESGNVYLTDTSGHYIYHPGYTKAQIVQDTPSSMTFLQTFPEILDDIQGMTATKLSVIGDDNVIAVIKLDRNFQPTTGDEVYWLIRTVSADTVFSPVRSMTMVLLAGGLVTVVPVIGLALLVSLSFTRPIRALTQTSEVISQSDLSQISLAKQFVAVTSQDEIGRLSQSFYLMTQKLISSLHESNELLDIVKSRTKDLQVSIELSRQITTVLNQNRLLSQLAELTQKSFGFYQVSIFRYQPDKRILSLVATSGEAGLEILEKSVSYHIDDPGLVPLAVRNRIASVSNDISLTDRHTRNMIFPETCSEAALPLLFGGEILGVLDLQSRVENRFNEQDIVIYTSYANQIAVAIRNAILFEELLIAKEQAEQAERVKSSFLANMSHELRSPLNTIITFSKFLFQETPGPVNIEQKQLIRGITDSGQLLLNLISDILDMSKIEAGLLSLYTEDNIAIHEILTKAIEYTSPILLDKPIELHHDIPQDLPLINGDRKRLLQIFLNILSNACKFTESGYVRVSTKIADNYLLVSVEDTGAGIASEDYEKVFEPFQQTESALRQANGTGLGMSICKNLVEAHNGQIWFESQLGQGTSFFVKLPVQIKT